VARSEYHDDSQSEATRTVEHGYDAQNRWIKTSLDADGAGEGAAVDRFFVYDGNQIILQLDDSGDPAHRYLWGPAVDQLLADEAVAGEVTWPLTDHLGTIRDWAAYDDETTIVNHILYDAFGRITEETNPADHLFYFTARPLEKETGLQNNLHRWYEPPTGKWLSEDPIGFDAGDGNLYRYVGNMPATAKDPDGLDIDIDAEYEEHRKRLFTGNVRDIMDNANELLRVDPDWIYTFRAVHNDRGCTTEEALKVLDRLQAEASRIIKAHRRVAAEYQAESDEAARAYRQLKRDIAAIGSALLARAAYEGNASSLGKEWYTLRTVEAPDGFRAVLFKRRDANKYVLAFTGTDEFIDWAADETQATVGFSSQYNRAVDLAGKLQKKLGQMNLRLVGHSLGGGLASTAALVHGLEATTFNPAGVHTVTLWSHNADRDKAEKLITAHCVKGEILTSVQDANWVPIGLLLPDTVGNIRHISDPKAGNPLERHGIDAVLRALDYVQEDWRWTDWDMWGD